MAATRTMRSVTLLLLVCSPALLAPAQGQETAAQGSLPRAAAGATGTATSQLHPNTDVKGNDLDCGQPPGRTCDVCGDINAVTAACLNHIQCKAFSYNGTCGHLKLAGQPRVKKAQSTVIIVTSANETATITASQWRGSAQPAATNSSGLPGAVGNGDLPASVLESAPANPFKAPDVTANSSGSSSAGGDNATTP